MATTNDPRVFNVKLFGAKGDGIEVVGGGAMTSGSPTFTASAGIFTAADVGKIFLVDGCGTSGRQLVTTISAFTSSTVVTLANNAGTTASSQRFVFGSDSTAGIQKALQACYDAGGGKVWIPNGLYLIGGALQTSIYSVNPNCQIYVPSPTDSRDFNKAAQIIIEGESGPNFIGNDAFNSTPYIPGKKGTVLLSTIVGSGTAASILGGKGPATAFQNFIYTTYIVKNLTFLTATNSSGAGPTVGGINFSFVSNSIIQNVMVMIDNSIWFQPNPTNEVAGIMQSQLNGETIEAMYDVAVMGFKYGIVPGEHVQFHNVQAWGNANGFVFMSGTHSIGGVIKTFWNTHDILVANTNILGLTSGTCSFIIPFMDIEITAVGNWYDNVDQVNDTNNNAHGEIRYNVIKTAGPFQAFTMTGASHVNATALYAGNTGPGGPANSMQFNLAGSFGGSSLAAWDDTNKRFTVGGGTGAFQVNAVGGLASGNIGMYIRNTDTLGQSILLVDNNRGSSASYGAIINGCQTNAIGNLFGVSRADKVFFISDGANNLAVIFGSLQNVPVIFGNNNAEVMRINTGQELQIGSTSDLGAYKLQVTGAAIITTDLTVRHIIGSGSTPTTTSLGTNVTSATVTAGGTDLSCQVTVVTSGAVSGTVFVLSYATAFAANPRPTISCVGNTLSQTPVPLGIDGSGSGISATITGVMASAGTFTYNIHTLP